MASRRGTASVRGRQPKKDKFYPLEQHDEKYYPLDKNFTNFNNVQYFGDSISKYDKRATNLSDENIIINLNQFNPTNNLSNIPMYYDETRISPILPYKADSYALCVASCYIPTTSVYLFEWLDTVLPSNGIPYDKYRISVEVNNALGITGPIVFSETLEFVPYVNSDLQPTAIKRVFEINQCIVSLNNAFKALWAQMGIITLADYNSTCYPPSFQLDVESSLIYILFDQRVNPKTYSGGPNGSFIKPNVNDYTAGESWVKIRLNYWIHQWLQSSFPCTIVSTNPSDEVACILNVFNDFSNTRFVTYPYGITVATQPTAYDPAISNGGNQLIFYQLYQFNSTTELFSTVQKVIVTSNIQLRPNYTRITGVGSAANITSDSMQYISTLIDFSHTVSSFNNGESASPIEYTAPWHLWQDLLTQDQLNKLSYRVFVQRTDGTLSPLELLPGEMCSIKLMFRLK